MITLVQADLALAETKMLPLAGVTRGQATPKAKGNNGASPQQAPVVVSRSNKKHGTSTAPGSGK